MSIFTHKLWNSEATDDELKETILKHEELAKVLIDKREEKELSPTEQLLSELGFS